MTHEAPEHTCWRDDGVDWARSRCPRCIWELWQAEVVELKNLLRVMRQCAYPSRLLAIRIREALGDE